MTGSLRKLLALPGIQFLATRFGGAQLRRWSFDEKFRSGDWSFTSNPASALVQAVERHAAGGDVLMLGCGTGSIAAALRPDTFGSFLGVDLSTEAVARAQQYAGPKIRFAVGDMLRFESAGKFSVVLFSESLYYVPRRQRAALLQRAAGMLAAGGQIVVTIAQPQRFSAILQMIRDRFVVVEDRALDASGRWLIVFH